MNKCAKKTKDNDNENNDLCSEGVREAERREMQKSCWFPSHAPKPWDTLSSSSEDFRRRDLGCLQTG